MNVKIALTFATNVLKILLLVHLALLHYCSKKREIFVDKIVHNSFISLIKLVYNVQNGVKIALIILIVMNALLDIYFKVNALLTAQMELTKIIKFWHVRIVCLGV